MEIVFRGFLVLGMMKFLGKGSVYPMVAIYCFYHFGKPWGEAVSSIIGGYILGVISLYMRTIFGGLLIHIGIAWMMELVAAIQKYVLIQDY
ncbi:CPBP family intramembrane glutamic endopeptidase [Bacteroidota bacterium]